MSNRRQIIIMTKLLLLLSCIFIGVSSLDQDIVAQIKDEAGRIPEFKLADSFYVRQSSDGDQLTYLHHKEPIFVSSNVEEKEQPIIVLHKKEDGLDDCGEKNAYVVLISEKGSNKYTVLYAYLRSTRGSRTIEWDNYGPRGGGARNKAFIFGHEHCTRSILTSCKLEKPDKNLLYARNLNIREKRNRKNDFVCDITNTVEESQLSGTILTTLNMAVTILAGADMIYKDEMRLQRDIVQQLLSEQRKKLGRSFSPKSNALLQNITETAAGQFLEQGKQSLSTGVLMFYLLLSSIGQLAEKLIHLQDKPGSPQYEDVKAEMRKKLGTRLLEGLFAGNFDVKTNPYNPFPGLLLKENVARQIFGEQEEEEEEEQPGQAGRRMTARVTIESRGVKATNNLNTALTTSKEKSAGQLFAQNAKTGFHVPYGIIEKAGDVIGNAVGIGPINEEQTILDRAMDSVVSVGANTLGSVVDVAANVLKPLGLGPLSKIVAGVGGSVLGLAAGIASCEKVCAVMAGHQVLKIGAKLLGVGGILGNKKKKKPPPPDEEANYAELYAQLEMEMSASAGAPPPMYAYVPPPPPMIVGVAAPPPPMLVGVAAPPVGVAVQQQPEGVGYQAQPVGVGYQSQPVGVGYQAQHQPGEQQPSGVSLGLSMGGLKTGISLDRDGLKIGSTKLKAAPPPVPLDMETELDLFTVWGWVSQTYSVQNLWMELKEPNIFFGFGTGHFLEVTEDLYQKIITHENYIDFLIVMFRIDNRKALRNHIIYLITRKYISYEAQDKIFILLDNAKILIDKNLTPDEEMYLFLSFELVAFSKAYKSLADFSLLLQCPSGERISKSVALIQMMTQEYISLVYTYGEAHLVKLIRNYGFTLKTMYTKSLQDVYRYNTCQKCSPVSLSIVDNSAITLYGLMQFVLYGSWDYYTSIPSPNPSNFQSTTITSTYNAYFVKNRNEFIAEVTFYII